MTTDKILNTRGVAFPLSFATGSTVLAADLDYIRMGIRSYLSIQPFEILFVPSGSRVRELLFEPIDEVFLDTLRLFVADAMSGYPGVDLVSVGIRPRSSGPPLNRVDLLISYRLKSSSLGDSFVLGFEPDSGFVTS